MKVFLIAVLMMQAVSVLAQTEVPDTGANASMLKTPEMVPQMSYSTTETLLPYASSSAPKPTRYVPTMDMSIPAYRPPGVFGLWKGAVLGVTGNSHWDRFCFNLQTKGKKNRTF